MVARLSKFSRNGQIKKFIFTKIKADLIETTEELK